MGKKRKSYFNNNNNDKASSKKFKFNKSMKLGPNMKGFLITYNCKFTFCLNEAKKLLEQFSISDKTVVDKQKSNEKSEDLEKLLKAELDTLHERDKEFNVIDTGAKHTIFISLESIDPNQVVESIFDHIETTRKPMGRFVQRLIPILNTCKSYLDDLEKCLKETLDESEAIKSASQAENVAGQAFTYCCVFKTSNNNVLSRDGVFKLCGSYMQAKNKSIKVDFDRPDYVLLIHVICNICYVSFLKNYFDYRKYNLIEMGSKFNSDKMTQSKSEEKKEANKPATTTIQQEEGDKKEEEEIVIKEQKKEEPESAEIKTDQNISQ